MACPFQKFGPGQKTWRFEFEARNVEGMTTILRALIHALSCSFQDRASLQLEIMALRHQLEALQRQNRGRLRLSPLDRAFWSLLYRFWSGCLDALVFVKPDTVVRWHRKGFSISSIRTELRCGGNHPNLLNQ